MFDCRLEKCRFRLILLARRNMKGDTEKAKDQTISKLIEP